MQEKYPELHFNSLKFSINIFVFDKKFISIYNPYKKFPSIFFFPKNIKKNDTRARKCNFFLRLKTNF